MKIVNNQFVQASEEQAVLVQLLGMVQLQKAFAVCLISETAVFCEAVVREFGCFYAQETTNMVNDHVAHLFFDSENWLQVVVVVFPDAVQPAIQVAYFQCSPE
jgi:hypothetical protein